MPISVGNARIPLLTPSRVPYLLLGRFNQDRGAPLPATRGVRW